MAGNSVSFAHPAIAQAKFVLAGPPGAFFHRITNSVRSLQESESVSVDEMIGLEVARGTASGVALDRSLTAGQPAANEHVLGLVRRWFWTRKRGRGFVLTGFPVNRTQARVFDEWLEDRDECLSFCLAVMPSEEQALREARDCHECPIDGLRYHEPNDGRGIAVNRCQLCDSPLVAIPDKACAEVRAWFASKSKSATSVTHHYGEQGLLKTIPFDENAPAGAANIRETVEAVFSA